MLHIAITGYPGSKHTVVGRELASRLDMQYISAYDVAKKWCDENNVNYYMFKNHYDTEVDDYVDMRLLALLSARGANHLLMDHLRAKNTRNYISIYVDNCILDEPLKAKAHYEEALSEIKLLNDESLFDETTYAMSFPSVFMSTDMIVTQIVSNIANGKFSGHYVHPYQVIPYRLTERQPYIPEHPKTEVFNVTKYGHCYFLTDTTQHLDYLWHLVHRAPMCVNVSIANTWDFTTLRDINSYSWLLTSLDRIVKDRVELCYRLARYAAWHKAEDHNQVYLDLSRNNNPLRLLRDSGF